MDSERHSGHHCPDLIEAPEAPATHDVAPTFADDIPGITARTSLKHGRRCGLRRRVPRHSGHHCPDLILIIVQTIRIPCREFRDLSFCLAAAHLEEASII